MNEQKLKPTPPETLQPRPAFTIFDFLHLSVTLVCAIGAANFSARTFGKTWAFLAFIVVGVGGFLLFGYATGGFVLFLYRRYTPQCRIGYEAACYVQSHYKKNHEAVSGNARDEHSK